MRKFLTFLLSAVTIISLCMALVGCGGPSEPEDIVVKFENSIEFCDATLNEPCDLTKYVKPVSGWVYSLEAYQIDVKNDMQKVMLNSNGLTFTPTVYDDAKVVLLAKNGNKVCKSGVVTIPVRYQQDEVISKLFASWMDESFNKEINVDPTYIKGEKSTSLKIQWQGAESNYTDRWQHCGGLLGDEVTDSYSLTSWDNAVLTYWVYNDSDQEIEFTPNWSHTGARFVAYEDDRLTQVAAPNAWTEIKYSLRYYGMTENFFYDNDVYFGYTDGPVRFGVNKAEENEDGKPDMNMNGLLCRWAGREPAGTPYTYSFYISGFDIRDYDETIDSDLDTTLKGFGNYGLCSSSSLLYLDKVTVRPTDIVECDFKITENPETTRSFRFMREWVEGCTTRIKFNVTNPAENSEGVTVTAKLKEDGTPYDDRFIVRVDLSKFGFGDGATIESIYNDVFFDNPCNGTYMDPAVKVISHAHAVTNEASAEITATNLFNSTRFDVLTFNYKLNTPATEGDSKFTIALFDGENFDNHVDFVEVNATQKTTNKTWATVDGTQVEDGWYKVSLSLYNATVTGTITGKLSAIKIGSDSNCSVSVDVFNVKGDPDHPDAKANKDGVTGFQLTRRGENRLLKFSYRLEIPANGGDKSLFKFMIFNSSDWDNKIDLAIDATNNVGYSNQNGDLQIASDYFTITPGTYGYYDVVIDLSQSLVTLNNTSKVANVTAFNQITLNQIWWDGGNCTVMVANLTVDTAQPLGPEPVEPRGQSFSQGTEIKDLSFNTSTTSGIKFDYKLTSGSKIHIKFYSDWSHYMGGYELDASGNRADGETGTYNGVTTELLDDGYVRGKIVFANVDRTGGAWNRDNMPDEIKFIYFESVTGSGYIDNISEYTPELPPRGQSFTASTDGNFQNLVLTNGVSFEYKITSGDHFNICLFNSSNWDKYYGYYEFTANGARSNYAGITTTKLPDGYIKVDVIFDQLDKTANSNNKENAPELAVNYIYVRGAWTDANGFIDNICDYTPVV